MKSGMSQVSAAGQGSITGRWMVRFELSYRKDEDCLRKRRIHYRGYDQRPVERFQKLLRWMHGTMQLSGRENYSKR